jgi:hypothetical protein
VLSAMIDKVSNVPSTQVPAPVIISAASNYRSDSSIREMRRRYHCMP